MIPFGNSACDPIRAILSTNSNDVLTIVSEVHGPSYRPVGAMMVIHEDNHLTGSLSSGCVESDIRLHGLKARDTGTPQLVRYGRDSPFVDIQLPCGGSLEVLLVPNPNRQVLAEIVRCQDARQDCTLNIDVNNGAMTVAESGATGRNGDLLSVRLEPDIAFHIFGKGPEVCAFAALVNSAAYPCRVISPDDETLRFVESRGIPATKLVRPHYPDDLATDSRTAVVLFFHDHDWEPPILAAALDTPAFYIGAQGSQRARDTRIDMMKALGVEGDQLTRIYGPMGLIPSARDSGTLAVSVLAEVLKVAMHGRS